MEIKPRIRDFDGKITHEKQTGTWYQIEVYFEEGPTPSQSDFEDMCGDTEWYFDIEWDDENDGVMFERRI